MGDGEGAGERRKKRKRPTEGSGAEKLEKEKKHKSKKKKQIVQAEENQPIIENQAEGNSGDAWFASLDSEVQQKIRSLERKVARRDKRLDASVVSRDEAVKEREDIRKNRDEMRMSLQRMEAENLALEKTKNSLIGEMQALKDKMKTKNPSGWARKHVNSQGKRVPSKDGNEMEARLWALSQSRDDYVEVQKGDFVRFLAGTKCLSYYEEAGTNIILPRNTIVPPMIKDLAIKKANESLSKRVFKGECSSDSSKRSYLFTEIATGLHYSLVGDHQGPVYLNDRPVELQNSWIKNSNYTADAIMAEQPAIVRDFLHIAITESKLDSLSNEIKKEAVVATLKLIIMNNRKQGLGVFGSVRGRAQRKLTVPQEMWPGKDIAKKNSKLPKLPPTVDDRVLDGPLIGIPSTFPEVGKKKKLTIVSRTSTSENTNGSGTSSTETDTPIPKKDKKKDKKDKKKKAKKDDIVPPSVQAILGSTLMGDKEAPKTAQDPEMTESNENKKAPKTAQDPEMTESSENKKAPKTAQDPEMTESSSNKKFQSTESSEENDSNKKMNQEKTDGKKRKDEAEMGESGQKGGDSNQQMKLEANFKKDEIRRALLKSLKNQ